MYSDARRETCKCAIILGARRESVLYVYVYVLARMCMKMYYMCMYMYIYTYIYMHTYTVQRGTYTYITTTTKLFNKHTHTYTHTHIQPPKKYKNALALYAILASFSPPIAHRYLATSRLSCRRDVIKQVMPFCNG
jgi:hypothetical protein